MSISALRSTNPMRVDAFIGLQVPQRIDPLLFQKIFILHALPRLQKASFFNSCWQTTPSFSFSSHVSRSGIHEQMRVMLNVATLSDLADTSLPAMARAHRFAHAGTALRTLLSAYALLA